MVQLSLLRDFHKENSVRLDPDLGFFSFFIWDRCDVVRCSITSRWPGLTFERSTSSFRPKNDLPALSRKAITDTISQDFCRPPK